MRNLNYQLKILCRHSHEGSFETRVGRERQLAALDVHAAEFGTAVQGREHLAGIQQAQRVKSLFNAMKQGQLVSTELNTHFVYFLYTNTVFAGDGAAPLDTQAQDSCTKGLSPLKFTWLVGIVKN